MRDAYETSQVKKYRKNTPYDLEKFTKYYFKTALTEKPVWC
jgi:hypothetical protein